MRHSPVKQKVKTGGFFWASGLPKPLAFPMLQRTTSPPPRWKWWRRGSSPTPFVCPFDFAQGAAYDAADRLTGVSGGGVNATYTYNGDELWVRRQVRRTCEVRRTSGAIRAPFSPPRR